MYDGVPKIRPVWVKPLSVSRHLASPKSVVE
jgi:hypothetical protein